jgi:hypothetical protein
MAEQQRPRSDIVAAITSKLAAGALPDVRVESVWAGPGTGRLCAGCDAPIPPSETEVEIDLAGEVVLCLHQRCFSVWQERVRVVQRARQGGDTRAD